MRHLPGWVVGALGTAAIVASFYAGGALRASTPASSTIAPASFAAAQANDDATAFEVACEPGQRAVVRQATTTSAESVACVSDVATAPVGPNAATVTRAAYAPARAYQPAVPAGDTVEVYRPRAVPVSYEPATARRVPVREVESATRSVKKSAVIIAGSTAVGATIGGVAKGKKGALIGGILGGGGAAVWDQVTRRRDQGR